MHALTFNLPPRSWGGCATRPSCLRKVRVLPISPRPRRCTSCDISWKLAKGRWCACLVRTLAAAWHHSIALQSVERVRQIAAAVYAEYTTYYLTEKSKWDAAVEAAKEQELPPPPPLLLPAKLALEPVWEIAYGNALMACRASKSRWEANLPVCCASRLHPRLLAQAPGCGPPVPHSA